MQVQQGRRQGHRAYGWSQGSTFLIGMIVLAVLLNGGVSLAIQPEWDIASPPDNLTSITTSMAGDVDGDGYSDLIVSYPDFQSPESTYTGSGMVKVIYGAPNGPGTGRAQTVLLPPWNGDNFGLAVSTAGDVNGDGYDDILIGWPNYSWPEPDNAGRALLYYGGPSGLDVSSHWHVSGAVAQTLMGTKVAGVGDVDNDGYDDIMVAGFESAPLLIYGSASGPGARQLSISWPYSPHSSNTFGPAGDLNADGVADFVLGEPYAYLDTNNRGRVSIFLGHTGGVAATPSQVVWQQPQSNEFAGGLGSMVGMAGDVNGDGYGDLLVGSRDDGWINDGIIDRRGRFLVYEGDSGGINTTPIWWRYNPGPKGADSYPIYGWVADTAGDFNGDGFADLVLVSPFHDSFDGTTYQNGLLQFFYGGRGGPDMSVSEQYEGPDHTESGIVTACVGDLNGDGFGDVVFSGQHGNNLMGFAGRGNDLDRLRQWQLASTGFGAFRGKAVAVLGDINGDGLSDAAVAAPNYLDGRGQVQVFLGTEFGLGSTAQFSPFAGTADDGFGSGLSRAGDLNGDGYEDLLVGAPGVNGHGAVYAYFGSSAGFSSPADWVVEGTQGLERFGSEVLGGFDCNGDGYADVLVGSPEYTNGSQYEGRCRLYLGGPSGPQTTAQWEFESNDWMSFTGGKLSAAGDVNRDGYADVLIGAPYHRVGSNPSGRVYLFLGDAGGLEGAPNWQKDAAAEYQSFGAGLGHTDLNRDGYSDVIIGVPGYAPTGRVEVYRWDMAGSLESSPYYYVSGPVAGGFGKAVSGAGDVNGDGYGDAVIGAPESNRAYLLLGGFSHSQSVPSHIHLSSWESGESLNADEFNDYGEAVAGGGDFNGDGFADVLVGDPGYHANGYNQGIAYTYLGNGLNELGGRVVNMRQNYGLPIPLKGRSPSASTFYLNAEGFSPYGRADVRLVYRVVNTGSDPQDGLVQATEWINTGSASSNPSTVGLAAIVGGLEFDTGYQWQARVESDNSVFPHSPWRVCAGGTPFEMHLTTAGPPPLPDLTVATVTPETADGGSPTTMTATVSNYGLTTAGASLARVLLNGSEVCGNIAVPSLATGATFQISCNFGYLPGGNNLVTVEVDTGQAVDEADENNNTFDHIIATTNYLTIYLQADGSGTFPTIQEALDAVNPGGTITLGDGTYLGAGNRDLDLSEKAVTVCSTSGVAGDCRLDFGGSGSDPHHGFRVTNGAELTIQNLMLSNGYRDAGSALSVYLADVMAAGVVFADGEATNAGGAVNLNQSGGRFDSCRFTGNHAVWGGGGIYLNNSAPVISMCVFDANTCDHWGGAVHGDNAATIFELASCTFVGNGADQGSSVYVRSGSKVNIGNTILALGTGGQPVWNNGGIVNDVTCSDVYGNAGGDFVGALTGYDDPSHENFSLDPEFCDSAAGNLHVSASSPCSEEFNGGCGLVGALVAGCGFEYSVAPDGSGDFPTIQDAVDGIADGSVINLLPGRFTGTGNRDVALAGRTLLIRYQGSDPAECVLDGEGTASVSHRLFSLSGAADLTLQNFTVTGGYAGYGGGVLVGASTLQAAGVVFTGQQGTDGGAVFGVSGSDLHLTGCRFLDNSSTDSGGAVGLNASSGDFQGCKFEGNTTVYGGGGVYLYQATAVMDSCLFADNVCSSGGGGAVQANQAGSVATVTGCTFSGNEANFGAAVYARYSGQISVTNSILVNSSRGTAVGCDGSGVLAVTCSDLFGNVDGDGLACLADPAGGGNTFLAPGFCTATANPYLLQNDSPCLPAYNSCAVQMGAYGVGCSSASAVTEEDLPVRSFLAANYPNPFNPQTVLSFGLAQPARTSLVIYDLSGRVVRRLVTGEDLPAGVHSYTWQGRDDDGRIVSSGTYLYRIQAGTYVATRKMTMLK